MKRLLVLLLTMIWLLCACGGEETPAPQPPLTEEALVLQNITLECSAPVGSDGTFPEVARAFGSVLRETLAEEGIETENVYVTFSRVDAATADALASGGVTLGIMGLGGALVDEGTVLLALRRNIEEPSCGLLMAGESEYGKQLAYRTKTAPLTAEEWSRAKIGAVESDSVLLAAAQQLLYESAGFLMEEYRGYATVEELLFAAECGEVDAAVVRAEDVEDYWALTESMLPTEGTVVLSSAAEELGGDRARQALVRAFLTAAESDEGIELLKQYGCGGFAAVTEEEIGAMRSLAMWEELK